MALVIFRSFGEAPTESLAFAQAQQNPEFLGRIRYELLDPHTLYPSDSHAVLRTEDLFGVMPQPNKVSIAGPNTNTVWAIRVHTMNRGVKRLLFFGLRRI
jgi:hypothetical protein